MPHMQHQVIYDTFLEGETTEGTILLHPDVWDEKKHYILCAGERWTKRRGWFARLSAPGYLDATDWAGPFKTAEEASDYLDEVYGDESDDYTYEEALA